MLSEATTMPNSISPQAYGNIFKKPTAYERVVHNSLHQSFSSKGQPTKEPWSVWICWWLEKKQLKWWTECEWRHGTFCHLVTGSSSEFGQLWNKFYIIKEAMFNPSAEENAETKSIKGHQLLLIDTEILFSMFQY